MTSTHSSLSDHELDELTRYLHHEGLEVRGSLRATLIAGGRSNLTYRVSDGWTQWVLRMPPRVGRTPSAHNVVREFEVTSALQGQRLPTPRPIALCQSDGVLGSEFYVAEYVDGMCIRSAAQLDQLDDHAVTRLAETLVVALVDLHKVDFRQVGLTGFGRADGYAARQLRRWRGQWDRVATPGTSAATAAHELAQRMSAAVPSQQDAAIVHGDYRIDNIIVTAPSGQQIAAVLDWELSTIGDPVADIALMCAYRNPAFDHITGLASAWTSPRLPTGDELAAQYESLRGPNFLQHWEFHTALAYYKIAVIAAGIDYRYRAGATSGPGFESAHDAVEPLLEAGLASLATGK